MKLNRWIVAAIALATLAAIVLWRNSGAEPSAQHQGKVRSGVSPTGKEPSKISRPQIPRPVVLDANPRVRRVYPELGFVTLEDIQDLGLAENAELEVIRDGRVIARLEVSAIKGGVVAADIVPGSLNVGDTVLAGDVIR